MDTVKIAFDRGEADSYYRRPCKPHYYIGPNRIEKTGMTEEEVKAYREGFERNERACIFKEW
jgi:hypothetical protein